ncbi:MAG: hypothetical protein NZ572_02620 [Thermoflexus sp.]|nr:hypothetical protein [Thermoflexus sp.]
MPPDGAALRALRPMQAGFQWLGSTLRLLPGLEIIGLKEAENCGRWEFLREPQTEGRVWIYSPIADPDIRWNGKRASTTAVGSGIYQVTIRILGSRMSRSLESHAVGAEERWSYANRVRGPSW